MATAVSAQGGLGAGGLCPERHSPQRHEGHQGRTKENTGEIEGRGLSFLSLPCLPLCALGVLRTTLRTNSSQRAKIRRQAAQVVLPCRFSAPRIRRSAQGTATTPF